MATYYLCSSNQRDALPTPYLPNEKLDSYHDLPRVPDNMMYLNQASNSASYSELLSGSSLSPYNSVEIPSVGEENFQYQELSLSLGMQIPSSIHVPSFQYHYTNPGPSYSLSSHVPDSEEHVSQSKNLRKGEYLSIDLAGDGCNTIKIGALNNPQCSISPKEVQSISNLYEPSVLGCTISNSKYLKAAQQLLDEVVNVHEALKQPKSDKHQNFHKFDPSTNGIVDDLHESTANTSAELSPAERQDLQSKMTKLSSMLDEVDKRYKQYYHQMQNVEASFDMVTGCGAAKPYTRLALHTISRQFRILRDTINGQIQVISQSLGEQYDTLDGRVLPRLRYVDKQLRQQRTLQQLGVVHHSWRPQRGLPESSVLILRAWLFEHFLHPYPKDSEKIMLARQAGLTRSQVANWFINARVRLWKPMVEDMYKEEFGSDSGVECKSSPKHAPKAARDKSCASGDTAEELQDSVTSMAADGGHMSQLRESKPDKINGFTARLGFQNGAHRDDKIDYELMNLHGDQRHNMDDNRICPEEIITLNHW